MSFDERGHQKNDRIYYVLGAAGNGGKPTGFFPTVERFIGEGGSLTHPRSLLEGRKGVPAGAEEAGKEAMGAFTFPEVTLLPGATSGCAPRRGSPLHRSAGRGG